MSKYNYFPKPLAGGELLTSDLLNDSLIQTILDTLNGGIELSNVNITGGTINNTVIGNNSPADAFFSNITVLNNTSTNTISNLSSITFELGSTITENSGAEIVINSVNDTIIDSPLEVNGNTVISGDLTVIGTIFGVPVAPPIGMTLENITTVVGTGINPSNLLNITFLTITAGVGTITTGTLSGSTIDGFYKIFVLSSVPTGCEYHLTINNLLDPFSQVISNKLVKFKYSGQSIILIYSTSSNSYFLLPGGSV